LGLPSARFASWVKEMIINSSLLFCFTLAHIIIAYACGTGDLQKQLRLSYQIA
jgi:hypothetical protein